MAELHGMENTKYSNGGINVEGIAWVGGFDARLKPEGITRVSAGARDFIFIVFDASGYAATD